MDNSEVFGIVMSIVCGLAAAFFMWKYQKIKDDAKHNRESKEYYDNIFKDAWAQHKDKFYMVLVWGFAIGALASISVPFMV